mmetsp:Transcript_121307/g.288169  ORF Transcript_121307/g.288169 Transcript_121307/m.288169 type:complete len:213 (-) Transcript_121307:550-1188(-)
MHAWCTPFTSWLPVFSFVSCALLRAGWRKQIHSAASKGYTQKGTMASWSSTKRKTMVVRSLQAISTRWKQFITPELTRCGTSRTQVMEISASFTCWRTSGLKLMKRRNKALISMVFSPPDRPSRAWIRSKIWRIPKGMMYIMPTTAAVACKFPGTSRSLPKRPPLLLSRSTPSMRRRSVTPSSAEAAWSVSLACWDSPAALANKMLMRYTLR